MKMTFSKWLLLGVLAFLAGCQSYTVSQLNAFVDEDGNILRVTYGRLEKDHVSHFACRIKMLSSLFARS